MKFRLITALIIATLFIAPQVSNASEPPTPACKQSLKWNRWTYTKAHINVTQSLKQHNPKSVAWLDGNHSQHICSARVASAKSLRLAEVKAWNKLRLQPSGVKWIIRRAFWRYGSNVVDDALHVASCESNFRPNAYNGADTGAWQINYVHHVPDHIMRSPELSTGWAVRAWLDGGKRFSPTWVCATIKGIH